MARPPYRRRSRSSQIVGDTVYIANRLPWWATAIFGLILFIVLYWVVPTWLASKLETSGSTAVRPMLEFMVGRRVHWFQWIAIAIGIACSFLAIRSYLRARRLSRGAEQDTNWLSRLIARLID